MKHIVKAAVTRRSSYIAGGIPTLDGDTQTEQKLSGSRLTSGDGNAATNPRKNVAASSPRAPNVSTVSGTKSTDRTTLCISLVCRPRRQRRLCMAAMLDAGGLCLWPECLDM